jgi:trans-aconitate methyltransferase
MMDHYKITQDSWNKLALAYQEKFMHLEIYNHTYDLFLNKLQSGASVLEIGCGPGNITQYLLSNRPDLRIKGIDTSPEMIGLARINNPGAEFSVMDCRELDRTKTLCNGIICGFCLPYLANKDVEKLVTDASHLLLPGGVLYLSMIEDDYSKSGLETSAAGHVMHVYYHKESDLLESLRENGFRVAHTLRIDYPRNGATPQVHLVMIAIKEA